MSERVERAMSVGEFVDRYDSLLIECKSEIEWLERRELLVEELIESIRGEERASLLPLLGEAATAAVAELERVNRIMVNQVRTNHRPDERIPTIELLIRARIDEIKRQGGFA